MHALCYAHTGALLFSVSFLLSFRCLPIVRVLSIYSHDQQRVPTVTGVWPMSV